MKIYYPTIVLLLTMLLAACYEKEQAAIITHPVIFEHKGSKTGKQEKNTLYEYNEKSFVSTQARFYMDVVSVYCGEDVCKIDPVRLHWDKLGFYQNYSLRNGIKLEKGQGVDFNVNDYEKLHKVLKNKNSALASLHKEELVQKQPSGNAVDGLSGATITILKEDYIKGAIWTCFTLWHFANGEVHHIIRNITGNSMNLEELNLLLNKNDLNKKMFAIEQLQRKKAFNSDSVNNILELASHHSIQNDPHFLLYKTIINYVNTLPSEQYFNAIAKLIELNKSEMSLRALQSLINSSLIAPKQFYNKLSQQLPNMTLYQEIDLFITLIDTKKASSKQLLTNLSHLLSHSRFSVARRVYWFLDRQPVSHNIKQALELFYQKNKGKL